MRICVQSGKNPNNLMENGSENICDKDELKFFKKKVNCRRLVCDAEGRI